ncbi:MAG: filamentous hemagglutinin N-terminal domain-containing protein [Nostoc indistinguendum CM1-VF10]|jgi:filamentous hemagglutinin family protein|nr:filamentous hemagglutinin N-terminal domain-containing protein [Nostoc indistinguendum CM1-VF10]
MSGLGFTDWGALAAIAFGVSFCTIDYAIAQITPDGTLPNNSSVTREGNTFNITGGTQAGGNLFHSFAEFSVNTGGTASFNNALDIQNIISRVTGGSVSNIDGIIRTLGTTNLFLINPNGIIFGENAQLNLGGSFVGTTASAISFGNQGFFSASNPESSPSLLTVNPSALLFNQIQAASIQNSSIAPSGLNPSSEFIATGLRVPDGKSLLLVGGDINMDGGGLYAFGGRVDLGGLKGAGTIELNSYGNNLSLSFPNSIEKSNVYLSNNAFVSVAASNGGAIAVNTRNLEITGESGLFAGIETGLGSENSKAGNVEINATGLININNTSYIANQVLLGARGEAGNININANTLLVKDGAQVNASTYGEGKGGNLTVDAQDVQIIGINANNRFRSGLVADVQPNSTGNAGDLTIKTNTLLVKDGAGVSASTLGEGKGGNLTVDAQDVQIIGTSTDRNLSSGLFANTERNSTGNAGDLTIKTNTLLVKDGAGVSASTLGEGKGGNLTVDAQNVQIIGTSVDSQSSSGLFASTRSYSTGNAGDLTIKTNTLLVQDGAQVSTSILGEGKGGNLTVDAQDVQIIGTSADGNLSSRLVANTERNSTGNAGDLTIKTNTLLVKDGAGVSASTLGEGKGGNLTVDAQDVQIIGTSANNRFRSRLVANTERNSTGNAGDLTIKTNTLLVKDRAVVSASTFGAGKGGNLSVDAQDVQIIGTSADGNLSSGLFASAQPGSTENGGDLTIKTNTLLLKDGGGVSASTFGAGKGGNLSVDAQDVQIIGTTADGLFSSGLFADAQPKSTGDAGNLTIKTNTLLVQDGAQVNVNTFGVGKGGNLSVDAQDVQIIGTTADGLFTSGLFASARPGSTGNAGDLIIRTNTLLVEDKAQVNASTVGAGKGGNLAIKTNTLLVQDGAQVSAATFGAGKGGNLTVDAQDVQIIGTSADNQVASHLFADAQPNSTGDAGNLTIKTNTLLVRNGAQVSSATFGVGKGGNLTVDAQDVQIIGTSADNQVSSHLFADAQPNSTGDAGDLAIKTNTLLVRDGAQVSSATFGVGKGGNLTVDAQNVQIIGTSADNRISSSLFADAQPNSTGDGGDLTIKTNTLLVRDGARIGVSTAGAGKGGNLSVDAQDVQIIGTSADGLVASGLAADAQSISTGDAGDLTIKTNTLLVQDEAAITVESLGTGTAGNMTLNASSIRLDNNALLSGNTQSAKVDPDREQATININSKILIMSRNSNIFTNATGENVIGGNINIDTDFLIGFKNSDISANSTNFRGGNVRINAQGIFGIQFRDVASDTTSDITATGANPEFSGSVELNTPDVDPNSGLVELPTVAVDTQIAQGCYSPGYAQNSFIITGRGGLPPNPREAFSSNVVRPEWATLGPSNDINSQQTIKEKPPISPPPAPIVEATGWGTNTKGEIVLTANASTGTPHKSWQQSPVTCSSAKSADN